MPFDDKVFGDPEGGGFFGFGGQGGENAVEGLDRGGLLDRQIRLIKVDFGLVAIVLREFDDVEITAHPDELIPGKPDGHGCGIEVVGEPTVDMDVCSEHSKVPFFGIVWKKVSLSIGKSSILRWRGKAGQNELDIRHTKICEIAGWC